jgi:hypothetical protein
MVDVNFTLQTQTTQTASFNSAGVDLKTGTQRAGFTARFVVSSYASVSTAGTVFTFKIQASSDNTTFFDIAAAPPITGTTAAQQIEQFVTFSTTFRYVRAAVVFSSNAGVPAIAYKVEPGLSFP